MPNRFISHRTGDRAIATSAALPTARGEHTDKTTTTGATVGAPDLRVRP
jgi:hypothetical protein